MERGRTNVERQAQVEREIGRRRHQMPEKIRGTYWLLGIYHVLRRRVLLINELCSEVEKDSSSVAAHFLRPKEIDRYPSNVQSPSMTYSLCIVDVYLDGPFDGASAHEYTCG